MGMTDPEAELELMFIREFLQASGYDLESLAALSEAERATLMAQASTYAADKLAEVDERAHFLHEIHGDRQ